MGLVMLYHSLPDWLLLLLQVITVLRKLLAAEMRAKSAHAKGALEAPSL